MELSAKLKQYLEINKAMETRSFRVYEKLNDNDRKTLFCEILKKYDIASPAFEDKGIVRRANIILILKTLTRKGDEEFGNFFEQFLYHKDGFVFYIAILAYARCFQEKAYSKLLEIIFDKNVVTDKRVYATYELSLISGQKFIVNNPPKDEREWEDSDFPLETITAWVKADRPKGNMYIDTVHERILNPDVNNPIDKLMVNIHKKYYVNAYTSERDIIDGKKNIGKPTLEDINKINAKWILPQTYKYFIENFIVKNELKREICIYSANELIERQKGFAFMPDGSRIEEWNQNYLVIADWNGDSIYCIDLAKGESSIVYHFYHDDLKFKKYATSFLEFLTKIV